jgi:hypothetical protein
MAYHTSRIATHYGKWGDVTCYHCTCSDDRASSDPAALKHKHALANPSPILHYRKVDRCCVMVAHGYIEVVGGTILLKEHAVRTDYYAIADSSAVDPASRANT